MNRIQHDLIQDGPEWHTFRAEHFGASEAAAMIGLSAYMTRTELLTLKKTGIAPDIDPDTQRRFDAGHATEAAARPIAEGIIGEELYPQVWSYGKMSASLDGLTMDGGTAFEHKLWNTALADAVKRGELPDAYMAQCQQIMMVTAAERVLFMVSDGAPENCVSIMVGPDPAWFERIEVGWEQFMADLETFVPVEVIPAAKAAPTLALPALSVQVSIENGMLALKHNIDAFGADLKAFIAGIPEKPSNDQEFVNCKAACKTLQDAQDRLDAAEEGALGQMAPFNAMQRVKALYWELARTTRLATEKLVAREEKARREAIVQCGKDALAAHVSGLNARIGKPYLPDITADFAGAIKGMSKLANMQDAVDSELALAKIEANAVADKIQINLGTLRDLAKDHAFLFADAAQIVLKANDDLTALVKMRIADHAAAEAKRLEAEREKIRAEEQAKAKREQEAIAERERQERAREEKRIADEGLARRVEEDRAARETAAAQDNKYDIQAVDGPAMPAPAAVLKPVVTLKASGKVIPSDTAIIHAVAVAFQVDDETALEWLISMFAQQAA